MGRKQTLNFYYDFSSPWCYIGYTQVARIVNEAGPGVQLNAIPILLGALFKQIGTPNMPMLAMNKNKMAYSQQDMKDWLAYWRSLPPSYPPYATSTSTTPTPSTIPFQWPSTFPIRTVLPLRVSIVEPNTIPTLFSAAWGENQN